MLFESFSGTEDEVYNSYAKTILTNQVTSTPNVFGEVFVVLLKGDTLQGPPIMSLFQSYHKRGSMVFLIDFCYLSLTTISLFQFPTFLFKLCIYYCMRMDFTTGPTFTLSPNRENAFRVCQRLDTITIFYGISN